jgi:hypothetical protein
MEMILMRKVSLIKLIIVLCFSLVTFGCIFDEDGGSGTGSNIAGTWNANVQVETCTPTDVCNAAGFRQGETFHAVMVLRQDGNDVEGTYTYQGTGINADIEGRINDDHLVLNGNVQHPLGRATVGLVGVVSGSVIEAALSHNVTIFDGRSGTVGGSGDFTR